MIGCVVCPSYLVQCFEFLKFYFEKTNKKNKKATNIAMVTFFISWVLCIGPRNSIFTSSLNFSFTSLFFCWNQWKVKQNLLLDWCVHVDKIWNRASLGCICNMYCVNVCACSMWQWWQVRGAWMLASGSSTSCHSNSHASRPQELHVCRSSSGVSGSIWSAWFMGLSVLECTGWRNSVDNLELNSTMQVAVLMSPMPWWHEE